MFFSMHTKKFFVAVLAAVLLGTIAPAYAAKVQIFKAVDPEKEVSSRVLQDQAVTQAFAQALYSESVRMIPGTLSPERGEALKWIFGKNYENYITGYKDMDVRQEEAGVSVSIDVNINRKFLRESLKKMGMFSAQSGKVESQINISNGKYELSAWQQNNQDEDVQNLMNLYNIEKVTTAGNGTVIFNVNHVSKKRWSGDLKIAADKWYAAGADLESVWRQLWEKYYGAKSADILSNPKALLVVRGWFNPDGVREFGRKLKSWDSAVQEVVLQDVEMKPTSVSASWSLEVSDQWVLRSYLNDYLPPRGLSFNLEGLETEQ